MNGQSKQIVYKVYKYFEERKNDLTSFEHTNDINLAKTVSKATGVCQTSVKKIVSEGRAMEARGSIISFTSAQKNLKPKKRIEIDCFIEGVIRRKVAQWYTVKKCIPSLKKLNAELKKEDTIQCSSEYLRMTLQRLGFDFVPFHPKRKLLVERHDIMRLRWYYIQDIKKYRNEGRPIVFLDETYIESCTTPKCQSNASKSSRLIVVHAGSRNGFVNNALLIFESHSKSGDYHGDMNAHNFQKWVNDKLLPNLPQNTVVVMDNTAYHNAQIDKKPTMCFLKSKMLDWLEYRGVHVDSSSHKFDLMKIISRQDVEKQYKIDELLTEKGHTVLRLPPLHYDLNPIEMVWEDIKGEFMRTSLDSSLDKKRKDLEALFSSYSADIWCNCDDRVIKNEDDYHKSDRVFDYEFDRLVGSLNEDDDDDDDGEDELSADEYASDMEID